MDMFDLIKECVIDFELGEMGKLDCEEGLSPRSENKEYLEGYRQQYAIKQQPE